MFGPLNLNPSRISEKNRKKLEKQNLDYKIKKLKKII